MKKFSKMMALGMALALSFGMSVSAADSPSPDEIKDAETKAEESAKDYVIPEGKPILVGGVATEVVISTSAVTPEKHIEVTKVAETTEKKDEVTKKVVKSLPKGYEVKGEPEVKGIIDVDLSTLTQAQKNAGVTVPLTVPGGAKTEGVKYMVLHQCIEDGSWETLPAEVVDGVIYVTFHSASPVAIVEVPVGKIVPTGEGEEDEDNREPWVGDDDYYLNSDGAPVSPKTGETMPVAGILAVICLAGAAVCAKKVRYNR